MYNGIGLNTARGSGTNGYVTRNLSFAKPKFSNSKPYDYSKDVGVSKSRRPNADVLLHKSKRQIEVECLELREQLESKHVDEAEIEKRVKRLRSDLQVKLADRLENTKEDVLMERKDREMARLKNAFGLSEDFREGKGFNFETEKQRQERLARIDQEERLQRRLHKD